MNLRQDWIRLLVGSILFFPFLDLGAVPSEQDPLLIITIAWMILFAVPVGLGLGMMNPEESLRNGDISKMGSFLSSLPISNEQISRAILMTAAKVSLISVAMSLVTFNDSSNQLDCCVSNGDDSTDRLDARCNLVQSKPVIELVLDQH